MEPRRSSRRGSPLAVTPSKRKTAGDAQIASIVTITETGNGLAKAGEALQEITCVLTDPTASQSKKKKATKGLAVVQNYIGNCQENVMDGVKNLPSPIAPTCLKYGMSRIATARKLASGPSVRKDSTALEEITAKMKPPIRTSARQLPLIDSGIPKPKNGEAYGRREFLAIWLQLPQKHSHERKSADLNSLFNQLKRSIYHLANQEPLPPLLCSPNTLMLVGLWIITMIMLGILEEEDRHSF
jgi:hypothetical protein